MLGGSGCDRNGFPLYVEVAFQDNRKIKEFLSRIHTPDGVMTAFLSSLPKKPSPTRVLIPAELGHLNGALFNALFRRPFRVKAFAIALFGKVNAIMCLHCIESFKATVTANREHVMFPFFECRSKIGFMSGSCANCVWNGASNCSCILVPSEISSTIEGALSHRRAPRLTKLFPGPFKDFDDITRASATAIGADIVEANDATTKRYQEEGIDMPPYTT